MNISELIKELEELREKTGADLTVVKTRSGEEVTDVFYYGAHYCVLFSEIDKVQDEIVRYVKNSADLERIANYIVNENLNDAITELLKYTRGITMELKYVDKKEELLNNRTVSIPYLHLEIYNLSNQLLLKTIKNIHDKFDYCLSITYRTLTDYDTKVYEFKLNKERNMFL
jgi:hypothetical protein